MNLRIDATDKGAGIGCMDRLVRHWYVCHPDGQDLGLIAPRFDTEAEAIAKRDLWNIDVPGHYVMGITEAPPATIFFRRTPKSRRYFPKQNDQARDRIRKN